MNNQQFELNAIEILHQLNAFQIPDDLDAIEIPNQLNAIEIQHHVNEIAIANNDPNMNPNNSPASQEHVGAGHSDNDYGDDDDDDSDGTLSSISFSTVVQNRRERSMRERERSVLEREEEVRQRADRLDQLEQKMNMTLHKKRETPHEQLKAKIDSFLANDIPNNCFINASIVGYAMAQHNYLFMSTPDRERLDNLRDKIKEVERLATQSRRQKPDPICRVCFEDLRNDGIVAYSIACGHVFCKKCVDRIRDKCYICRQPFKAEQKQLIFISYN